jgi:DNA repair photolyase
MGIACGSQVTLCEYPIRLDTYKGCSHGCRYCFARAKTDIDVVEPLHCARAVERFINGARTKDTVWCDWDIPLHWGGMSDPFQPAELEHRATLEVLEVLSGAGYPFIVSTKGRLVAREPYLSLLSKSNVCVQVSMTSPQLDKLEPGAPTFAERLGIVGAVAARVPRVIVRVQPYMTQCLSALIAALPDIAHAGAYGITIEAMKFKATHPGLVRVGGDYTYPDNVLRADYATLREACRAVGLAFFCAENRLRGMGDSTACCGCGDMPGFAGNRYNQVSIAVNGGATPTEAQTRPGSGSCMHVFYQKAGSSYQAVSKMSFAKMIAVRAKAAKL